jgi:O-antigen/teichoic acid export membrane protein
LIIAQKRYNYNFLTLFKAIRFDKAVYDKTKGLAFTSLYLTVSWILYYELDPLSIGKLLGAKQVAIYAIGLTILTFFRSVFGIVFSPFNVRFNHFIGFGDEAGLKTFVLQVVSTLAPIVVFPIVTIAILANPIVLSWVGINYLGSVEIIQFLVFCNLFAFISYPIATLLMAQERQKEMYFVGTLLPFVFWGGILVSFQFWGLKSFAIFKLIAFVLSALVYYGIMLKYLGFNFFESIRKIFKPMFFSILFLIVSTFIIRDYLPVEKAKINFLIVALIAGFLILISFVIQYFSSENWRIQINKTLKTFKKD